VGEKYLCVHGHFYQPPRQNPWLDFVEYQASAAPYHDWNERVTRECYGPNVRARLHGEKRYILRLINNYEYMSFNFGPTLLSWLERAYPWIYHQILKADKVSQGRYQGHGNALAQVYNHIIMPLACHRDKLTQIRWGLADFQNRFGRKAEGMWLAETAVDTETLDLMAREGVKFTILSPTQAQSVRPLPVNRSKASPWRDVSAGKIDTMKPYRAFTDMAETRFIDVFFYDGPLSHGVAYEKILASGEAFLSRIEASFGEHQTGAGMVNVATDGESYGHHFKFGDLALSWMFHKLEHNEEIRLTNYGLFLERFPPDKEVRIIENSSWSCAHGIERWRADCGCRVDHKPGWNQAWRKPLRQGLDWLREELAAVFEARGAHLFQDPWKARDDYLAVFSRPTEPQRDLFLARNAVGLLGGKETVEAFQLMESQRMALYMFTSCGWFFDDISGLEATQVLKYAARAIDLVRPWTREDLESRLMDFLSKATSNDADYKNGSYVYQKRVQPSRIGPSSAAGHYALATLVDVPPGDCIFPKLIRPVYERRVREKGIQALVGEVLVGEATTCRESRRTYVAVCRDGRDWRCLVGKRASGIEPQQMAERIERELPATLWEEAESVLGGDLTGVRRYTFHDLIPDTRRCVLWGLAEGLRRAVTDSLQEDSLMLKERMKMFQEIGEPLPEVLAGVVALLISDDLSHLLEVEGVEKAIDWKDLFRLAAEWESLGVPPDPSLKQKAGHFLRRQTERLPLGPDPVSIRNLIEFLDLAEALNLDLDLWECQNTFYDAYHDPEFIPGLAPDRISALRELGCRLGFLMEGD
jgi:alpha-amylase/alpha-mannosidase (GH57 family)